MLLYDFVIGVDEVGRGAGSHDIVIGAVRVPLGWNLEGLKDSKKTTEKKRFAMEIKLKNLAEKQEIFFYIAKRSHIIIDEIGLQVAQNDCFYEAINKVYVPNSKLIIDGNYKFDKTKLPCDYENIEKADSKISAVMAAAMLAKTYRDRILIQTHD